MTVKDDKLYDYLKFGVRVNHPDTVRNAIAQGATDFDGGLLLMACELGFIDVVVLLREARVAKQMDICHHHQNSPIA